MKFKTEMILLFTAIIMFAVSVYFYSYQNEYLVVSNGLGNIPCRFCAFSLVGVGSIFTVAASVSFNRKSKEQI